MTDTVLTCKGRPITDLTKNELVDAIIWAFQEIEYQRERADRFLNAAALAEPEPEGSTPQPADGGVAELVAWLRAAAEILHEGSIQTPRLTRAADLLERMAPRPIPVTERLPEPEDCDAEGMCWWYCAPAERWLRCGIPEPDPASQVHTHWLPANALPLPKEVV